MINKLLGSLSSCDCSSDDSSYCLDEVTEPTPARQPAAPRIEQPIPTRQLEAPRIEQPAPAQRPEALPSESTSSEPLPSLKQLIELYAKKWVAAKQKFVDLSLNQQQFIERAEAYVAQFKPPYDPATAHGYIEKRDLEPGTKIFVRADTHGDLKSPLENLRALQQEGALDENFKCRKGVQIVFLGDYGDRGSHSMQILETLMALKMENPDQVTLIRGNHEYVEINSMYCGNDVDFKAFLFQPLQEGQCFPDPNAAHQQLLTSLYETMPLSLYCAENSGDTNRQYVQFTHGLFELYVDPAQMLDQNSAYANIVASKKRELSGRVSAITVDAAADYKAQITMTNDKALRKQLKQQAAAHQIKQLWGRESKREAGLGTTPYNWGDVDHMTSNMGDPGMRRWKLKPQDIQHALRLASAQNKVKMIFRGHQHEKQHYTVGEKIIATTLPVGMDSQHYAQHYSQKDTAYVLTTAPKVKDWQKVAFERVGGSSVVTISDPLSIYSLTV